MGFLKGSGPRKALAYRKSARPCRERQCRPGPIY